MSATLNILDAMATETLFAPFFRGDSWDAWRVVLKALFALEMSEAEFAVYKQLTGRSQPPSKAFTEVVLIVGRRGGKSRLLAAIAVFLACFFDYTPYLAPGEVGTIAVLAANRAQSRSIFRFVSGLLKNVPVLAPLIVRESDDAIELSNRVVVEIGTASFKVTRGYSYVAVLADEVSFWMNEETSSNPAAEILRAVRPGLANIPGALLLLASSPYGKSGPLYDADRRYFGRDDGRVLVVKGPTELMNPLIPKDIIAEAFETDPEAARSEFGRLPEGIFFRDDLSGFLDREQLSLITAVGRREQPPMDGVIYQGFVDVSAGVNDSFTCAIGHQEGDRGVLDSLAEWRPPFDPANVVKECAALLRRYGVSRVVGDHFSGMWSVSAFAREGIILEQSARPKSAIYADFLPLANSRRVELLDNPRLANQFCGLERRTSRSGKDSIAEPPGAHDDLCNAVAGVLVSLDLDRRPALIRTSDILYDGSGVQLTRNAKHAVAVFWANEKTGEVAMVYAAIGLEGPPTRVFIDDFTVGPMRGDMFVEIRDRLAQLAVECRAHRRVVAFVPEPLAAHARSTGLTVQEIPEDLVVGNCVAEGLVLSAAAHIAARRVAMTARAIEKSRGRPFMGALDFKAGEALDSPLRAALILLVVMALDNR
jgi:hypothetical protein